MNIVNEYGQSDLTTIYKLMIVAKKCQKDKKNLVVLWQNKTTIHPTNVNYTSLPETPSNHDLVP